MQYIITEQQGSYRVTAPSTLFNTVIEWWFDDLESAQIFVAHDAGKANPGQYANEKPFQIFVFPGKSSDYDSFCVETNESEFWFDDRESAEVFASHFA